MANNNENKILNVPHLRFPEFSGEWKKCKFGDIATGFDYGMNAAAKPFDGENKYIRITDIDEASSQYLYDDVVSPDGELGDSYLVKENDILLARTGASTGKSYLYRNSDGKLYFAGFLIRANIYKHNSYFVFSQLHTHRYKKWISVMSARSGQPGINSQEYASFPLYTTSLQEEDKIASFLKLLDERIATQNKIIEDLKKLKSAIIHRCYSSQTKMIPLSELLKQCSDRNRSGSDLQVLSVSNKYGFIAQSDQFEDREVASDDTSNYKVVKKGMFAYNPARINIGSIALYEMDGNGIVSPMYVCFTTKSELLPSYLKYYFASQTFKHEMYKRLEGSVRLCLTFEELCNIEIHLPSIEQQKNISKYISKIENNLSLVDSIFSKYQQQRRYLLSQMFI
jgi:type I restriction enzyme S subunit